MKAESKGGLSTVTAVFLTAMLVVVAAVAALSFFPGGTQSQSGGAPVSATAEGLSSFQSYPQLQSFIAANAKSAQNYDRAGGNVFIGGPAVFFGGALGGPVAGVAEVPGAVAAVSSSAGTATQSSPTFTGTNDQVQGVDEPDIVKTDGTHLFVATNGTESASPASGGVMIVNPYPGSSAANGSVTIINAYPPTSAAVLSTLTFPRAEILGIEVAQDRLMVIDQRYTNTTVIGLLLFNTASLSAPKLMSNFTVAGNYVAARLAQGYLYAVIQQPSYQFDNGGNATGVMPYATSNGDRAELPPSSVYYTPNNSQIGDYTMVISVSMASGVESTVSVLSGPSSTVYVSTSNIYVVYVNYPVYADADNIPGDAFTGGVISANAVQLGQNSTIFRAAYSNGTVAVQAVGSVPGSVLNQFSMNEYDGYFQVATSRFATLAGNTTRSDDVYVLDQKMSQVAALQNIAPGENLYAVRFVGDMGYVVTFEQVDPLFAISFQDPTHPVILSALKVNGYSDYLQQLFPGYLIGVGKDTVASSTGDFAYYLGLKLSLFHIAADGTSTDVQDYYIGDRGTDSPVLTNHLAFTWDPTTNMTVIPVLLYKVSGSQTTSTGGIPPYGNPVWQGAYVLKVTQTGITMLGNVTQYPPGQSYGDSPNNNLQIERSLIIGNYLYTVSAAEVMVSSMSSLSTVATVALPGS